MKLWSRLCFLVLVISYVCRGQKQTTEPNIPHVKEKGASGIVTTLPSKITQQAENDENRQSPTTLPDTTAAITSSMSTDSNFTTTRKVSFNTRGNLTTLQPTDLSTQSGKGQHTDKVTTVSKTSASSSKAGKNQSSLGYTMLVLIIIVIIFLCTILYFIRRANRTYSFDLQRPSPGNHLSQAVGTTFEPVYMDDLERSAPNETEKTDERPPSPVANGTSSQLEGKGSGEQNAPQEQLEANGTEALSTSNTSPSLGDDQADEASDPLSSDKFFFDGTENENNNNPSVCSSDPFVEINLDEPAWGEQLFTSPEAPSSVLPLSPFSIPSSSS
ncbi:uncharacterized protein KZ484_009195 [Pholidichthys leucotaenia]